MSASPKRLVIATRESRLALWQARHVQSLLQALYPAAEVSLLGMTTRGDQILDRTLSKVGGKGLFVKELETALLDGRADLAVHSLKDVPVLLDPAFELAAILPRENPADAFVSPQWSHPGELPAGAVVGTSSLRREAQLRALWPHLKIQPLRGNLDTRLAKLDRGEYDAIVLAAAGLSRLGLQDRIRCVLDPAALLPAAGQGALGIEIVAGRPELKAWLAPLICTQATACTLAERQVSRVLGGSCSVPLAAHAQLIEPGQLLLEARLGLPDGTRLLTAQSRGPVAEPEILGDHVARVLLEQGAADIMAALDLQP